MQGGGREGGREGGSLTVRFVSVFLTGRSDTRRPPPSPRPYLISGWHANTDVIRVPDILTCESSNVQRKERSIALLVRTISCPTGKEWKTWCSQGNMPGDGLSREPVSLENQRFTLRASILASLKLDYRKIAVGHGVKVPSPAIFHTPSCSASLKVLLQEN